MWCLGYGLLVHNLAYHIHSLSADYKER